MAELQLLNQKNEFHSDIIAILLDKSKINRFKTVQDYCENNKLKLNKDQLPMFTKKIEKLLLSYF